MEHLFAFFLITLSVSGLYLALMAMGGILALLEKIIPGLSDKLVKFFCR